MTHSIPLVRYQRLEPRHTKHQLLILMRKIQPLSPELLIIRTPTHFKVPQRFIYTGLLDHNQLIFRLTRELRMTFSSRNPFEKTYRRGRRWRGKSYRILLCPQSSNSTHLFASIQHNTRTSLCLDIRLGYTKPFRAKMATLTLCVGLKGSG